MSSQEHTVPIPEGEGGEKLSKNALKKLAKEKEKAEKAAKRKEAEDQQKREAEANDISANDYGDLPLVGSAEWKPSGEKRTTLREVAEKYAEAAPSEEVGGPIVVFRAAVQNAREQSAKLTFLVLGYRSYTIQAVVAASDVLSRQMVKFAKNIPVQSNVLVHGLVKKPKDPVTSTTMQNLEIHVSRIFVISRAAVLPIQPRDCLNPLPREGEPEDKAEDDEGKPIVTLNTRLNNRNIDLTTEINDAIFTIKHGVEALFTEFLSARGFRSVRTPKMLGAASEGGSNVFEVKYFQTKAYLAQSPQLAKQKLIAAGFERVMEIGPVFRAENSNTNRHLTEFTGLDLEMVFEEDYHEVVALLEELMLFIFHGLRERYGHETAVVRKTYPVEEFKLPPPGGKVPRLTFPEGIAMLKGAGVEIGDLDDLSTEQEKFLGKLVLQKYGSDFYVLDQYPLAVRPFYTMPSATGKDYSNSYDFHMRGQEILSGAQRVHSTELLKQRMKSMDPPVDPESSGLKDYVDCFKYGCLPHAGAGLGLERIVMLYLGLPNIRLASLYPRDPSRLEP